MFDEDSLDEWQAHACGLWGLELGEKLAGSTCSDVWTCQFRGQAAVLKLPFDPEEAASGAAWLKACRGLGAVEVLALDEETGAVLLERLPGPTLEAVSPPEAREAFACLCESLWRCEPWPGAAPVESWYVSPIAVVPSLPAALVEESERLLRHLLETTEETCFLHGDLHHYNVLGDGQGGWKAIDPKGLIGDPAYEAAAFLRNPITAMHRLKGLSTVLAGHIGGLSRRLGLSEERIWGWGLAVTVRCIEDEGEAGLAWRNVALALWELRGEFGRRLP